MDHPERGIRGADYGAPAVDRHSWIGDVAVGIRLIVEVLDHAPSDISQAELNVMIVIAETVRDETRTGWPGMDLISRRSRLKPDSVQKVLRKLAARGIELRVPIGKDKKGNLVYATKGHRSVYVIPPLQSPDECPPLRPAKPGQRSAEGRTTVRQSTDVDPALPLTEPSNQPSSSSATSPLVTYVMEATGATEEEATQIVEENRGKAKYSLRRLLETMLANGDLIEQVNEIRKNAEARRSVLNFLNRGDNEVCPQHKNHDALDCNLCWALVKGGDDPYQYCPEQRPEGWYAVYQWPPGCCFRCKGKGEIWLEMYQTTVPCSACHPNGRI